MISIAAKGVDTEAIINDIVETAGRKASDGTYAAAGLDAAALGVPLAFDSNTDFLDAYLGILRDTAFVDISDFEIVERRSRFARPLVRLKKLIWSLLRFYTYRLWSQQNQVNGLLLAAIEGMREEQREKLESLEKRITALEAR